jgi:tyrosyl-tRNA synthetase
MKAAEDAEAFFMNQFQNKNFEKSFEPVSIHNLSHVEIKRHC